MGVDFSEEPRVEELLADESYIPCILYPGKSSVALSNYLAGIPAELSDALAKRERSLLVFVIDGTWTAAKKMMKLSQNLHGLPRVALDPKQPSRFLIKHQPNPLCLSTIESLYHLLAEFEDQGLESLTGRHKNLMEILEHMVQTQLEYINDPTTPGYRKEGGASSSLRKRSKKHRKVFPFFR